MSALTTALVLLAGGVGSALRFLVDAWVRARTTEAVPWGTVVINLSGSLLLGLLAGLLPDAQGSVRLVVGVGLCGGFTTFSTAMLDAVRLAQGRRVAFAAGYAVGTLLGSAGAAGAGLALGMSLS